MNLDRRSFLRIAGSSAVILAAGSAGCLLTPTPSAALAPWDTAGNRYADPRMRVLSYAILAPNPHNRQPWLVDLDRPGEIVLHCDPQRLLPETDPFGRQIVIGLGCFLELLRMAAAEDGVRAEIESFPEGISGQLGERPIARVRLTPVPGIDADPLFRFVLQRRSNKEPFDTDRPVAAGTLEALRPAAFGGTNSTAEPDAVAALRELTWQAHVLEARTPRTLMESVRLMRIGKAEINANPDGIDLGGPMLEVLRLLGQLDRDKLADPESVAFSQGLDMYREIMHSAMAYVWLVSPDNGRRAQLAAGRDWLRLNLRATELGLAIHPVSQALQEYPEMSTLYDQMRDQLGAAAGETVQMLGRLGYGPSIAPSPRWPLETRIRTDGERSPKQNAE